MTRRLAVFRTLVMTLLIASTTPISAGNVDLPRFPSISPDGSQLVFTWRGDLWKAPADGGTALRLTRHPGDDLRSAWNNDGSRIAFTSNRDGYTNIYTMRPDGTDVQRVTDSDRARHLQGYARDDEGREMIAFHSYRGHDVYRSWRPYVIAPEGGAVQRIHDAFGSHPATSPDGRYVAFVRGGWFASWSRRGYRGPEAQQVWLYDRHEDTFTQLTTWDGNEGKPRWACDKTIVFMSDRQDDCVNLYRLNIHQSDETPQRLTQSTDRDVHHFDVARNDNTLVFMKWDTLYTLNLDQPDSEPVALQFTATEDSGDNTAIKPVNREVSHAALSPDGQVMATIAYGRVFVRNIDERSPTQQITTSHSRARDLAWSPCGLKLYFTSDKDDTESIYAATVRMTRSEVIEQYNQATQPPDQQQADENDEHADADSHADPDDSADADASDDADDDEPAEEDADASQDDWPDPADWHDAILFDIEPMIQSEHSDQNVQPSPCGRYIAFRRDQGDVMIHELESEQTRQLVPGWDAWVNYRWSPGGHYLAYSMNDLNMSSNVFIVPTDGSSDPVNISRHPRNDIHPRFSADGRILAFRSNRTPSGGRSNHYDVWAVYLDRALEGKSRRELDEYYRQAQEAADERQPLPVNPDERELAERPELDLDDAYLRVRRITSTDGAVGSSELMPGGDRMLFNARVDGDWGLYSIKWDGSDRTRLGTNVSPQHVTLTGDQIVYVNNSRAGTVSATGEYDDYDIDATLRIDLQQQASQKFNEAARRLGMYFYDEQLNDLDWPAVTRDYYELATQTRTGEEFNYVASRFVGELNASHLSIRKDTFSSSNRQAIGRLGVDVERVEHDDAHAYRVTRVLDNSPAELGTMKLREDDIITSISLEPFAPRQTLHSALRGTIGKETLIGIQRTTDDGDNVGLHVLIEPISYSDDRALRYDQWRKDNAQRVDEWSDGRVGYIHIEAMNMPSLEIFTRDLYVATEGRDALIIDVRNNGGGWTADRILASIMTPEHAYTRPRGANRDAAGHYPQDRLLVPRFTGPVNMVSNNKSFSNAEILAHAFKTLERGTLVGEQTFGGVISTGRFSLIDGTTVRRPFRGWFTPDGTDMDEHGAMPDLLVPQTPEAEAAGNDEQLRAAVQDILERVD